VKASRILVTVPTRGHPCVWTVNSLQRLRSQNPGLPEIVYFESHLSVCHGRNAIVKTFLESKADFLFMLDDDVVPCEDILGMATHGVDVVASPVYINRTEANVPFPNVFIYDEPAGGHVPYPETFSQTGLVTHPLLAVGTGCICIARHVLETVRPAFEHTWTEDGLIKETEDLVFCRKARMAGYQVHADYSRPSEQMVVVAIRRLQERNAQAMLEAQRRNEQARRATEDPSHLWMPA